MNFYIVYGHRKKVVDDLWHSRALCQNCGGERNFRLKRVNSVIHICFIPILSFSTKWALVCEGCDGFVPLKRKEYRALMKEQTAKLEGGQFPEDVIRNDFEPKKLKVWWKLLQLICTVILSFYIIGLPLLYFAVRNYSLAKKKQKAYKNLPALIQ